MFVHFICLQYDIPLHFSLSFMVTLEQNSICMFFDLDSKFPFAFVLWSPWLWLLTNWSRHFVCPRRWSEEVEAWRNWSCCASEAFYRSANNGAWYLRKAQEIRCDRGLDLSLPLYSQVWENYASKIILEFDDSPCLFTFSLLFLSNAWWV